MSAYVVATIKPWNIDQFNIATQSIPGDWTLIGNKDEMTLNKLENLAPRYIFFPHWSWMVPEEIINKFECVCFHMTDLPYGRGGSPLQNLILRGHTTTKISAIKMIKEIDAGPVYLKKNLSLKGSAGEIYKRGAEVVFQMIREIIETEPKPSPQTGESTEFKRRMPNESELPSAGSIEDIYNHIRMLDAPTYPRAFLKWGNFSLEFSKCKISENEGLSARVTIKEKRDV